jgi:hypothetical protein
MQHTMTHYTTTHHRPCNTRWHTIPQHITDHATHDGTLYHNTSQTMQHTMAHYTTTHHRPCNTRWHTIPQHITDHATHDGTLYHNTSQTMQHTMAHYTATHHRPCNTRWHTIPRHITDHATHDGTLYHNIAKTINTLSHTTSKTFSGHSTIHHTLSNKPRRPSYVKRTTISQNLTTIPCNITYY